MLDFILMTAMVATGTARPSHPAAVTPPRYFFTIYAGQSVPFRPRTAHTWGTYTKVISTPDGKATVDSFAISWLPAEGNVKPLSLRSVPGKNYTHEETLAIQAANNGRVSYWGPYEIDEERFRAAEAQRDYLESGAARYRALDSFNMNRTVVNCVHAMTHAEPSVRNRIQPVIRVGEPGTSRLAQLYVKGGAFLGFPERQDWVLTATGGDPYPTTPRLPGEEIARQLRGSPPAVVGDTLPTEVSARPAAPRAESTGEAAARPRPRRANPVPADPTFIVR